MIDLKHSKYLVQDHERSHTIVLGFYDFMGFVLTLVVFS